MVCTVFNVGVLWSDNNINNYFTVYESLSIYYTMQSSVLPSLAIIIIINSTAPPLVQCQYTA